jgi:hypothetical protein
VLPHQRRVHARELERAHPVARGHQRLDQPDGGGGAHRLRRREPAPPARRGGVVLPGRRGRRQRLERSGELAAAPHPLRLLPGVELGRLLQPKPFQERSPMEPHRPFVRPLLHGFGELARVAGDPFGIELEGGGAEEHVVGAERAANGVKRLVERVPGRLGLTVGPEQRQEALARHPARAGGGDDGQQREPAALGSRTGVQLAILVEDQTAEGA